MHIQTNLTRSMLCIALLDQARDLFRAACFSESRQILNYIRERHLATGIPPLEQKVGDLRLMLAATSPDIGGTSVAAPGDPRDSEHTLTPDLLSALKRSQQIN